MKKLFLLNSLLLAVWACNSMSAQCTVTLAHTLRYTDTCATSVRVVATAANGVAPYTFTLGGISNQTGIFENVPAGPRIEQLSVRDANQCTFMLHVTIPQARPFNVYWNFSLTNCAMQQGRLNVGAYNGFPPYRYQLDSMNFQTDSIFQNVSTGRHTLTVQSQNGCTTTVTMDLWDALQARNYTSRYESSCNQNGDFVISATHPRFRLLLDGQTPEIDSNRCRFRWRNQASGEHLLQVTDSAANCAAAQNRRIQLNSNDLQVTLTRLGNTCNVDTVQAAVTSNNPPFRYFVNGIQQASNIFPLAAGVNTIMVLDANNCQANLTHYVQTSDSLRSSHTFVPNSCGNSVGTLRLRVTSSVNGTPLAFSFNGLPISNDTIFNNITSGTFYVVRGRSPQGCDVTGRVYVNTPPVLTSYPRPECANRLGRGQITFSNNGTPPYRYDWTRGAAFDPTNVPTGTHTLVISDAAGCTVTQTVTVRTCVWAGDTDTSGVVNQTDLLNVGLAFGATGPVRCAPSGDSCMQWRGFDAAEWSNQTADGTNYKHIDTNGDGIINAADQTAITRNWTLTRPMRPEPPKLAAVPIWLNTTGIAFRAGTWIEVPIMLGDAANPAQNAYGSAFSVIFNPLCIDNNTISLVTDNSWLGSQLLSLLKTDPLRNQIDIGMVKTNHQGQSGNGMIGKLRFQLRANAAGTNASFEVAVLKTISHTGQIIVSTGSTANTIVLTKNEDLMASNSIQISPNPSEGAFQIAAQDVDIQSVALLDATGRVVEMGVGSGAQWTIQPALAGVYWVKIATNNGFCIKKIVKL